MGMNSHLVNGALATGTLNINGAVTTTITAGPSQQMVHVAMGTLSATLVALAQTTSLAMYGVWQVSNDNSTWVTLQPSNSAAIVAIATGTAGTDTAVTKVLPANPAVYGWRYARLSVKNTGATGASTDTYSISYNYRKLAV